MRRTLSLVPPFVLPLLLLLFLAAVPSAAQSRFLIAPFGTNTLLEVDVQGQPLRTVAALPPMNVYQLLHANDNVDTLVFGQVATMAGPWQLLRVTPGGAISTVARWTGPAVPLVQPDGSGDYLVTARNAALTDTYFLRLRNGSFSTLATAASLTVDGFSHDPRTGHLFARGINRSLVFGYYNVDVQESSVTTITLPIANVRNFGIGSRGPIYRAANGEFVDLYAQGTQLVGSMERIDTSGINTLASFGPGTYPSDLIRADQRDAPVAFHALVYQPRAGSSRIVSMQENGFVTAVSPPLQPRTWHRSQLLRVGSRNLVFRRTGPPNDGMLDISYPGEAARPFVAAFSLSGVTPGLPVGDGRTIPLNPDVLTPITATGGLPGLITGTLGTLDGAGRAAVRITLNSLGSVLEGVRLWVAVVVLDPRASRGLAQVSEPMLIELR